MERFKYEISRDTANGMTFYDIIEIFPIVNGKEYRVLMFKIPAAGIPTDWKTNYYERAGESLVALKQYKIDAIRSQERKDWSKQVLEKATIEHVDKLRALKLVEGRITSLYLSASAAKSIDESTNYIKNKGFDDKYYKDLIIEYLKQYEKAKKKDIRELLWDKLPNVLSDIQKENKIRNMLTALRKQGIIDTDSENQQKSNWILK